VLLGVLVSRWEAGGVEWSAPSPLTSLVSIASSCRRVTARNRTNGGLTSRRPVMKPQLR